ncbi:MAG TPA: ParB/RepB/Spo0J family partition protein [Caulobacteraceae bacterium]|nr:ParB/RepB/Spo0J family partition protein [Caulobacteraceae bacterium]
MSKRQSEYLSTLLNDPAPPPPATAAEGARPLPSPEAPPAPRPVGTTLLARESALARIATGEVKQVTQLLLDPARVSIWAGNARHQASLTEESCRDLIDSILAEGGQKVPVVVRRVADDPAHEYELIVGTRRHWSISWLRANNYPDLQLLAQVQNLDDESAFRLADLENRARRDVSDFERARNYREALKTFYGDRQNRMAERLNLSKGWLSKMMTVAALPDWAVAAYASPADIQLKVCYGLAQRLATLAKDDPNALKRARAEAEAIAADQTRRRARGEPSLASAEVTRRLQAATHEAPDAGDPLFRADSAHGRIAVSVLSSNRNGATVRIHAGSGASDEEIVVMVAEALAALKAKGKGVAP